MTKTKSRIFAALALTTALTAPAPPHTRLTQAPMKSQKKNPPACAAHFEWK